MKRTVDEKYAYNMKRMMTTEVFAEKSFSSGYCMGVALYKGYPKVDAAEKKRRRDAVDAAKLGAKNGNIYHKGIMCGVRDAANERKNRRGK